MSKPSGFVPIPFHVVGKLLMSTGALILVAYLVSMASSWFFLPAIALWFSLSVIVIGIYLIFIVPGEPVE